MGDYHIKEDEWKEVKGDVKVILTNHLPHINVELASLKTRVIISWVLIIGAAIVERIFS